MSNDDAANTYSDTKTLLNTLYLNSILFGVLMVVFEINRHIKTIYLKRIINKKLIKSQRVPPIPPSYPFGWIIAVISIDNEDLHRMVGLDAYMLLRFIILCCRYFLINEYPMKLS